MAFVQLDTNGDVNGMFAGPQNPPAPAGYTIIDDSDPRIVAFQATVAILAKPKPTPREWLERLAPATQLALETAALANAQVALWLRKATGAGAIDVTLPETQQGVAAMVAAGLLTAADQTLLLAP